MNLALVCDVRLAATSARFDTRFLQLGIHPGGGHTWMLRRVAGPQTAAAPWCCSARCSTATEAERAGLVWRCVDDDELLDAAHELAARAASAPRELTRRTKATMRRRAGHRRPRRRPSTRELEPQLWSMDQPDVRRTPGRPARRQISHAIEVS